ncbi:hypothetical protein HON88_07605 [Candidatus Woesearchaeota archaeon]|jgi:hypothetical protein|nr:hypothetical protein [Candidatus Woesearchaeota archaeon]
MLKKRSKRGQATHYIIVGIVALILVVGIGYITSVMQKSGTLFGGPSDPVSAYTQECLQEVTKQGLSVLGQQAGHIYLDDYALEFLDDAPFSAPVLKVSDYQYAPYWFYQGGVILDDSEMPRLEKKNELDGSVQDQLERFIVESLPICLNDYKKFEEQGVVIEPTAEPVAVVTFTDESVVTNLYYPLDVEREGETITVDSFNTGVNIRFKEVYELAREIVIYEDETNFLEQDTQDLITAFGRVDPDALPPLFGGLEVTNCGEMVFWLEEDVKKDFKSMLTNNIPYIKLGNTKHEGVKVTKKEQKDKDLRATMQGVYDTLIEETSNKDYPNIRSYFEYRPNFPLELFVGQRGVIKPSVKYDLNYIFGRTCFLTYQFGYTYKYPVLVTLLDEESNFDEQPYMFQFPMMVITEGNFPRMSIFDALGVERGESENYFCQGDQRQSGDSEVIVLETSALSATKKPLAGAFVYFQCGPRIVEEYDDETGALINATPFSDVCMIGTTDEDGKLTAKFPTCIGGSLVSVQKPGYASGGDIIGDVMTGISFNSTIEIRPLTKLKLDLKKYFVIPPISDTDLKAAEATGFVPKQGVVMENNEVKECNLYSPGAPLSLNEEAIITIRNLERILESDTPMIAAKFKQGEDITLELGPGTYEFDIMLLRHEKWDGELDIKKHSQSYHFAGGIGQDSKDVSFPDQDYEVESVMAGGAKYLITITEDDLVWTEEADTMTLYVFDEGKPKKVDEYFAAMAHTEKCSEINYETVKPKFSVSEE